MAIDIKSLNDEMDNIEKLDEEQGHKEADEMFHNIILELAPPELKDDLKALIARFNKMHKWYS